MYRWAHVDQDTLQQATNGVPVNDSLGRSDSMAVAAAPVSASAVRDKEKAPEQVAEKLPNFFFTHYSPDLRPKARYVDPDGWILPLLLGAFFLVAIVQTLFPRTIRMLVLNMFKRDAFRKMREEDNMLYRRTLALMLLVFLMVAPVFIYQVASHFKLQTAFLPFIPVYWQLFLIGAGILGFKLVTIQAIGYLFDCTLEAGQYILGIILMNCFLGVLFIPVSLGIKISTGELSAGLLLGGLGIFGLFYLISLAIGIGAGMRSGALSKFHLILYFCTLEILPVFLIIKTVRNIL